MSGAIRTLPVMSETLIGYARCSTDAQDLTAQRDRLHELGVAEERIYLDHGLTGTNRKRPGLDQALAAVRAGDTLVVPMLDRLARSVPDARVIGDVLMVVFALDDAESPTTSPSASGGSGKAMCTPSRIRLTSLPDSKRS
jgi:hypothetical protein